VGQSFGLITGITFVVVVLLVGFFFLILTVQKLRTFTALRAVGASPRYLGGALLLQIGVVVLAAVAIAVGFLLAALATIPLGLPASPDPALAARVLAAVLAASLLAGLVSVARIRRLNPADVA
jgi:putative ABC transport system permease protein